MSLAEQLTEIYEKLEDWHRGEKLNHEEAIKYHERILSNGQCITISSNEKVVGYCEFEYDSLSCYIRNLFILPEFRGSKAIWKIRKRLFEICKTCVEFKGDRNKNGKRYAESKKKRVHL